MQQPDSRRLRRNEPARFPIHLTTRHSRKSSGSRPVGHGQLFRPGDPIRESGIYEVVHDNAHRVAHEVVLIADDRFPTCDTCAERVRFRLVRTAPYIFQDIDFEDPA